jgi:hypothetical protein
MYNMSVYSTLFSRSIEGVLKKTFKFSLKNPAFVLPIGVILHVKGVMHRLYNELQMEK